MSISGNTRYHTQEVVPGDGAVDLDQMLGIQRDFDADVVERLEEIHSEDEGDARVVRAMFLRRMVGLGAFVGVALASLLLVGVLLENMHPAQGAPPGYVAQVWHDLGGAVRPSLALTVNTSLLGLVASINVALAAATNRGNRRDDAINSIWRKMLGWCSFAAATIAQGFSVVQFASIGADKSDYGFAAATILIGIILVFLSVTIVQHSNSADRARNFTDSDRKRQATQNWVRAIRAKGVPVEFPARSGLRLSRYPGVPRVLIVLLLFVLISLAYTYLTIALVTRFYPEDIGLPDSAWSKFLFVAYVVGYSAGMTVLIGNGARQRWSRSARFFRLRLVVWLVLFRFLYVVGVSSLVILLGTSASRDWRRGVLMAVVVAGPLVLMPCIAWFTLWLSRQLAAGGPVGVQARTSGWLDRAKNGAAGVIEWLTAPVWQSVSRTLEDYYRHHTVRRDHAYEHELEATSS